MFYSPPQLGIQHVSALLSSKYFLHFSIFFTTSTLTTFKESVALDKVKQERKTLFKAIVVGERDQNFAFDASGTKLFRDGVREIVGCLFLLTGFAQRKSEISLSS